MTYTFQRYTEGDGISARRLSSRPAVNGRPSSCPRPLLPPGPHGAAAVACCAAADDEGTQQLRPLTASALPRSPPITNPRYDAMPPSTQLPASPEKKLLSGEEEEEDCNDEPAVLMV